MFKGRALREKHTSFCNSGVNHPAGEVVECTPIARVQLDVLDYAEGSGGDDRSNMYRVKESTTIIIRKDG